MNLSDLIFTYIINLATNAQYVVPMFVWLIAVWRVSRLRGAQNYQEKVDESVAETLKEQISTNLLQPLFDENGIPLPPGKTSYDIIDKIK